MFEIVLIEIDTVKGKFPTKPSWMFYVLDVQLYKLDTGGVTQSNQNYEGFFTYCLHPHQKEVKNYLKILTTN